MHEANLRKKELAQAAKEADRARGSRMFAVLPWLQNGMYHGRDVIRWFKTESAAEKFGGGIHGGRGVVVRRWTSLIDPDAPAAAKTPAELEAEIAAAIRAY